MNTRRVRALLMGGQACVFYGAAEFSRDIDFAIYADAGNLARLRKALDDLNAGVIAVPPFEGKFLKRGHAIHFRSRHPESLRMRVDVMSKMRGVDSFAKLWRRRTVIELPDGTRCNLLSLPDLVQAKKTQRDKDWPMIRRLVEAHYFQNKAKPDRDKIFFWFLELRTASLLEALAKAHPAVCRKLASKRPLLAAALAGNAGVVEKQLLDEETLERNKDRAYWTPLKKELEWLRREAAAGRREDFEKYLAASPDVPPMPGDEL